MDSIGNRLFNVPQFLSNHNVKEQYEYLRNEYNNGAYHLLLNNIEIFGPFPQPEVPWDISEVQKIATYNKEVTKVLTWLKVNVIVKLVDLDYRTLNVLIRIATGMLNKCNIPKEVQIMFHDNMVESLNSEYSKIVTSDLPF